jgi:hypothetical protein
METDLGKRGTVSEEICRSGGCGRETAVTLSVAGGDEGSGLTGAGMMGVYGRCALDFEQEQK